MSGKLNVSVLVAARDEYIEQLKCIIVPLLVQGFNSIYQDALKISGGKRVIWKFQELLKQIPQWNQSILQEESKRIKKKCGYIMDIVTAIFVTNVKILASVRLKGSRQDIRVKIPTSDIFIHSIYIESAHQIFYNPFLFYHRTSSFGDRHQNNEYIKSIIENSVVRSIHDHLPFDDILQKYLADALNENAQFGEGGSDSGSEPESDSDEESINNNDFPSDEESEDDPEEETFRNVDLNNNTSKQQTSFTKESGSEDDSDSEPEDEVVNSHLSHFSKQGSSGFSFFDKPTPVSQPVQQPVQPQFQPPPVQQMAQEPVQTQFQPPPVQQMAQPPQMGAPPQESGKFSFF
jgi:hypothetical protein